jgi:hypothetical protein
MLIFTQKLDAIGRQGLKLMGIKLIILYKGNYTKVHPNVFIDIEVISSKL